MRTPGLLDADLWRSKGGIVRACLQPRQRARARAPPLRRRSRVDFRGTALGVEVFTILMPFGG